jgi:hypothetical protein
MARKRTGRSRGRPKRFEGIEDPFYRRHPEDSLLQEMLRLDAPLEPYGLARVFVETHPLRGDAVANMKRLGRSLGLLLLKAKSALEADGQLPTSANKRAWALHQLRPRRSRPPEFKY